MNCVHTSRIRTNFQDGISLKRSVPQDRYSFSKWIIILFFHLHVSICSLFAQGRCTLPKCIHPSLMIVIQSYIFKGNTLFITIVDIQFLDNWSIPCFICVGHKTDHHFVGRLRTRDSLQNAKFASAYCPPAVFAKTAANRRQTTHIRGVLVVSLF